MSILPRTEPGTVVVETDGTKREVLYSGPVNTLMSSSMRALQALTVGNAVIGPMLWHYCIAEPRPFMSTTLFFIVYGMQVGFSIN
jgi:hypothetical protein